jgi:hypothetical protein
VDLTVLLEPSVRVLVVILFAEVSMSFAAILEDAEQMDMTIPKRGIPIGVKDAKPGLSLPLPRFPSPAQTFSHAFRTVSLKQPVVI